jgi:transcriptional regulator with XRE-family HTH domain
LKLVLGANIRTRRKSLGLTQESLAEKAGTAPTYIAMIESGRRAPSFRMIERIAEVLEIDAPELFTMQNYPPEPAAEIRKELANRFDQFLRASIREIENKGKK